MFLLNLTLVESRIKIKSQNGYIWNFFLHYTYGDDFFIPLNRSSWMHDWMTKYSFNILSFVLDISECFFSFSVQWICRAIWNPTDRSYWWSSPGAPPGKPDHHCKKWLTPGHGPISQPKPNHSSQPWCNHNSVPGAGKNWAVGGGRGGSYLWKTEHFPVTMSKSSCNFLWELS